jgi:hypothetical protein
MTPMVACEREEAATTVGEGEVGGGEIVVVGGGVVGSNVVVGGGGVVVVVVGETEEEEGGGGGRGLPPEEVGGKGFEPEGFEPVLVAPLLLVVEAAGLGVRLIVMSRLGARLLASPKMLSCSR